MGKKAISRQHQIRRQLIAEWRGMSVPRKLAPPKALADEVASALEKLGMNAVIDADDILNAWCDIVPPIIASNTRPSGLREGCLEISVLQPAIHYTLEREMKHHLLKRLQSLFGRRHIRAIRFRLG